MIRLLALLVAGALGAGAAPAIGKFTPDHARSGNGAFTLTVAGTGFASGAVVKWGGVALATTFVNETTLTAAVGAERIASAGNVTVTVESGGSVSAGVAYPVLAGWTVSGLSKHEVEAGSGDLSITINGQGFPRDAYVLFGAARLAAAQVTPSQLSVTIPAALLERWGYREVAVNSAACSCGVTSYFRILIPVTSVEPASVMLGQEAVVTVRGRQFNSQLFPCLESPYPVIWPCNGTLVRMTFEVVSETEARITLWASSLTKAGKYSFAFMGTDEQGARVPSIPRLVEVTGGPAITTAVPDEVKADQGDLALTVSGSGFTSNTEVWAENKFSLPPSQTQLATAPVSATQLKATMPASLTAGGGLLFVKVVEGGVESLARAPVQVYGKPDIVTRTPAKVQSGSASVQLRLQGHQYSRSAVVRWDGRPLATTRSSEFVLIAEVPPELVATAGKHQITVEALGGISDAVEFGVEAAGTGPVLTKIEPAFATQYNENATVTVTGSGFKTGAVLYVAGSAVKNTTITPTSISGTLSTSTTYLTPGMYQVYVMQDGLRSNELSFSLAQAGSTGTPELTELIPERVTVQSAPVVVTVKGLNFSPSAVVQGDGRNLPTTYVNSQTLTVMVDASYPRPLELQVLQDVTWTNKLYFWVLRAASAPAPAITSLSPEGVTAGAAGVSLKISGQHLAIGSVTFRGVAVSASAMNSGLEAQIPAGLLAAAGPAEVVVTVSGATPSRATFQVYAPPQISAIAPARLGIRAGTATLTVNGANFRSGATLVGAEGTTYVSPTQLTAAVRPYQAGAARSLTLKVRQDGVESNAVALGLDFEARLQAMQPATATTGLSDLSVTAVGTGLVDAYKLCWNGTPLATSWSSDAGSASAVVPSELRSAAGTAQVTVCQGTDQSNALPFTVTAGTLVTGMQPSALMAGRPGQTITVTGREFPRAAVIRWNETALSTTGSTTTLTAAVPEELVARPGNARVQVETAGGQVLDTVTVPVLAGPAITELRPARMTVGSEEVELTILGRGFFEPAEARWNGGTLLTRWISTAEVRATVPGRLRQQAGGGFVSVRSGSEVSSAVAVVVEGENQVVISSVSPERVRAGAGETTLQVRGSGFGAGAVVLWDGEALATERASENELMARLEAGRLTMAGQHLVQVRDGTATSGSLAVLVEGTVTIASFQPAGVAAGRGQFALTVKGSGFAPGTMVTWNARALATEFVNETTVVAQVPAELVAEAGTAQLVVLTAALEMAGPVDYVILPAVGARLRYEEGRVLLTMEGEAPRELRGEVELSGSEEAAFQFWSGGRRALVTVAAGAREGQVAGEGRVQEGLRMGERSARLTKLDGGGISYLPAEEPQAKWEVRAGAPQIERARWREDWLELDVRDAARDLTSVELTMVRAGAAEEKRTIPLRESLQSWYESEEGQAAGGTIRLRLGGVAGTAVVVRIHSGRGGVGEVVVTR